MISYAYQKHIFRADHIIGHEYICGREYISYTVNAVKERVAAESSDKKFYTNWQKTGSDKEMILILTKRYGKFSVHLYL